jgi:hypothetical protein
VLSPQDVQATLNAVGIAFDSRFATAGGVGVGGGGNQGFNDIANGGGGGGAGGVFGAPGPLERRFARGGGGLRDAFYSVDDAVADDMLAHGSGGVFVGGGAGGVGAHLRSDGRFPGAAVTTTFHDASGAPVYAQTRGRRHPTAGSGSGARVALGGAPSRHRSRSRSQSRGRSGGGAGRRRNRSRGGVAADEFEFAVNGAALDYPASSTSSSAAASSSSRRINRLWADDGVASGGGDRRGDTLPVDRYPATRGPRR